MTENKKPFVRAQCESCGAALKKTRHRGEYVCQYCGAVYHNNNYDDTQWEEDVEEVVPVVETPPADMPAAPSYSSSPKKIALWVWLGLGATLIGCIILSLLGGLLSTSTNGSSISMKAIEKPVMLSALPAAVKAGESVAFAGWEIAVDPDIKVNDDKLSFAFTLKNWNDSNQVLRYKPNTIIVYDDLGNSYPVHLGSCDADLPYLNRQVSFDPYGKVHFSSNFSWCDRETSIPTFFGVVPVNAKHLYLHLEDFGVFKNITFVFDL